MVSFNFTIALFGAKTEAKYRDVTPLIQVSLYLLSITERCQRVWMGGTNVSCQLKFRLFVSCQLNFIACCFLFRLQERQKHFKSSDKVIFVLTTAVVKRKRKIRSRKNSTCVRDKHCISMTSNLDTNTRFKRGTSHVSYQIQLRFNFGTAKVRQLFQTPYLMLPYQMKIIKWIHERYGV